MSTKTVLQPDFLNSLQHLLGRSGTSLQPDVRGRMERQFARDFSAVEIHADDAATQLARAIGAAAFTVGNHIVFGEGLYRCDTSAGCWLLAHELVHVVQQARNGLVHSVARYLHDPCSPLELEAGDIATLAALAGEATLPPILGTAPAGLVQLHPGPPCPLPPRWIWVDAEDETVWRPANEAIERAYAASVERNSQSVLYGSDFDREAFTIQLPKGAPDRASGNALLNEFKGRKRPLCPDIMDFRNHVFYEIKTLKNARKNKQKVKEQLVNYYRTAEAVKRQIGGPSWNQDLAGWYPKHRIPFGVGFIACTKATEYNNSPLFGNFPGMILYEVFTKVSDEEEKDAQVAIVALAPELSEIKSTLETQVRRSLGYVAVGAEYTIIAPPEFFEPWILAPGRQRVQQTTEWMQPRGAMDFRNPAIQLRTALWGTILVGEIMYLAAAITLLTGGGDLLPAGEVGGGAVGSGPGLMPVLIRGLVANDNAIQLAKASGVILVVGAVSAPGQARAGQPGPIGVDPTSGPRISSVSAVRAVPLNDAQPAGDFSVGREVQYQGQKYREIGRAKGVAIPDE